MIKDTVRRDFGVSPYISEMLCMPFVKRSSFTEETLRESTKSEYILFEEDFADGDSFMEKLQKEKQFNDLIMENIRGENDSLTDDLDC